MLKTFVMLVPELILGQVRLSAKAGLTMFGSKNWMKEAISPVKEAKNVGEVGARVLYQIGNYNVQRLWSDGMKLRKRCTRLVSVILGVCCSCNRRHEIHIDGEGRG